MKQRQKAKAGRGVEKISLEELVETENWDCLQDAFKEIPEDE